MENKKIYAFDFDGTIVTNEFPKIGKPIKEVIDLILQVQSQGHYIILNTMREGERLGQAVRFCMRHGIYFDAVNDNLPHMKAYYKNNPRKIFANYYIDDHNMGVSAVNEDFSMLEQQLKAKDKALDKACEALYLSNAKLVDLQGNLNIKSPEQWKEWAENGIN